MWKQKTGGKSMSLIKRECELLNKIAAERFEESNGMDYLHCCWKEESDSYYEEPRTNVYLESYQFETPIELQEIIKNYFNKTELPDELVPVVLAATFKLKDKEIKKEEIMETIYNF